VFIMCGKSYVCDVHCGGGVYYIYVILVSLVGITS
jgi:hypothetical protein